MVCTYTPEDTSVMLKHEYKSMSMLERGVFTAPRDDKQRRRQDEKSQSCRLPFISVSFYVVGQSECTAVHSNLLSSRYLVYLLCIRSL